MKRYHIRRSEKEIKDREDIIEIIQNQKYLTMAMSKNDQPYLVTMNYGYDKDENCFYFHCADEGKKIDFLEENPMVWGQILEDLGYVHGKCDHHYRTVHFKGKVKFLKNIEEKREALSTMIEQLEDEPDPIKKKMLKESDIDNVGIGKIKVEFFTGKKAE